jgi:predicted transcriptional regulator
MRGLQNKAAAMAATCENPELKSALDDLAEEFRYSDPVSSEATEKLEMRMDIMLDELKRDGSLKLAQEIRQTLAERNQVCKQNK